MGAPIVQRNLGRINELILNMLAYSKGREPRLENLNVNTVVEDCVALVTPRADERGVALLRDLDDVPAIPTDADGLRQAVLNLLSNALDAVSDLEGVITVSTRYNTMNRLLYIKVIDNGHGMDPEEMEHIFTPFYSSKGQRGTGLGLTVTKKIIEEHGGRVETVSTPGRGTTFTITLSAMPRLGGSDDTSAPARRT